MGWQRLLNIIQTEIDNVNSPIPKLYRVRKTWTDNASQIGAFSNLKNAKAYVNTNPGYSVFNSSGVKIYPTGTIVEVLE